MKRALLLVAILFNLGLMGGGCVETLPVMRSGMSDHGHGHPHLHPHRQGQHHHHPHPHPHLPGVNHHHPTTPEYLAQMEACFREPMPSHCQ
jgi:ABC-type nickel/cobalt efflux system permease component RcnA